jgi:hypothetical protein
MYSHYTYDNLKDVGEKISVISKKLNEKVCNNIKLSIVSRIANIIVPTNKIYKNKILED